jgi:hypothetical protein
MIRQQYQECPAYRVNSFLKAICKVWIPFQNLLGNVKLGVGLREFNIVKLINWLKNEEVQTIACYFHR